MKRLLFPGKLIWYSLMIIAALGALIMPSVPARAETPQPPPINLELGGEGASPWALGNIKPGDGGTKTLTLHNAGSRNGFVTIWISSIIDIEGGDSEFGSGNATGPGELSKYLSLQLLAPRLGTNLAMPAPVAQFPHAANSSTYIRISSLPAGGTAELTWKWQLPPATTNNVQGDRVLFALNYMLEEMPVEAPRTGGTGGAGPSLLTTALIFTEGNKPGTETITKILSDGTLTESYTITALRGGVTLSLDKDTRITTLDGGVPQQIQITTSAEAPPVPKGMLLVSPLYDITAYVDKEARKIRVSQPLTLVLRYSPETVPNGTTALPLMFYDEQQSSWVELEPVSGFVAGEGEVAAHINHFTRFAVMALVAPPRLASIVPPAGLAAPARFQLSNLEITPEQVSSGDSVIIRIQVTNTGGLSGERSLTLKMNGLFIDAKVVKLAPGQTRTISFTATPYKPGSYQVEIGELQAGLTVNESPTPLGEIASRQNYWLTTTFSILAGSAAVTAIILLIFRGRKLGRRQTP